MAISFHAPAIYKTVSNFGTSDSCSFKIKFDHKDLPNPHFTINNKNPFGRKFDQMGSYPADLSLVFIKKIDYFGKRNFN